jgi:hypothetical protein
MKCKYLLVSILLFFLSCSKDTKIENDRLIVGAIRWDGWSGGPAEVNQILHRTLAPQKFHDRIPFFGKEVSSDSVQVADSSQQVMEKEIAYAKIAALDYWAFVTYPENSELSIALRNYLRSSSRKEINFCAISEEARFTRSDTSYQSYVERLLREPGYQSVMNGRPLWYIGFVDPGNVVRNWGSFRNFKKAIDGIRRKTIKAGLKNPYVVLMDFSATLGKQWYDSLGCDAISSYVAQKQTPHGSYKQLNAEAEQFWNECKSKGASVVPIFVAGWSPKPRIDYRCIWSKFYPSDVYYSKATPEELAWHFEQGFQWMARNKKATPAQCALVYAWNEYDEGGWLAPTLSDGTKRIEAIAEVIKKFKNQ